MTAKTVANNFPYEQRPLMVFSHGVGSDPSMWQPMACGFEKRYKILPLDWMSSGESALAEFDSIKHASLYGYASDLVSLIVQYGGGPVTFIGYGVGGTIGVLAAIANPECFSSLVLICTSPCYINDAAYTGGFMREDIEERLDAMENEWTTLKRQNAIGRTSEPLKDSNESRAAMHLARLSLLSDHRADMLFSTTRTLIIQAQHDLLIPPSVGEFMQDAMPDSSLRIVDFPGRVPPFAPDGSIGIEIQKFLTLSAY